MKRAILAVVAVVGLGVVHEAQAIEGVPQLEASGTLATGGIRDAFPGQVDLVGVVRVGARRVFVEGGVGAGVVTIKDAPGTGYEYVGGGSVKETGWAFPVLVGVGGGTQLKEKLSLSGSVGFMHLSYRALDASRSGSGPYGRVLLEWRQPRMSYGVVLRVGHARTSGSAFPKEEIVQDPAHPGCASCATTILVDRIPTRTTDTWVSLGVVISRAFRKK